VSTEDVYQKKVSKYLVRVAKQEMYLVRVSTGEVCVARIPLRKCNW
jgi:hypothetical protein